MSCGCDADPFVAAGPLRFTLHQALGVFLILAIVRLLLFFV